MLKFDYIKKINCPISPKLIEKTIKFFSKEAKSLKGGLEIAVIGDREMKKINYHYRGKNKTTDVLSFAFQEEKNIKTDFLGQIFISYAQIKRQAKEYKISEKEEFVRMLVHGLLHLIGHDHETKTKEQKMFKYQELVVSKILNTCPSVVPEERRWTKY